MLAIEDTADSAASVSFEERLLTELVASDALKAEHAERAANAHAMAGGSIVDVLIRLGLCEEKGLASTIASLTSLPLMKAEELPAEAIRLNNLSVPFMREARILPLSETDKEVFIAVTDPTDAYIGQALRLAFDKPIKFQVATASQIEDGILRLYASALGGSAAEVMAMAAGDVTENDLSRLRESASEAPIVRFVDRLIARAVDVAASDIHIEPFEQRLRVRLRIDGILIEDEVAPLSSAAAIVSRVKIMARLDIAERRLPQDGAVKLNIRGKDIDLRIATTPVIYGEEVVIRILDQSVVRLDLVDLGFSEMLLRRLTATLDRPNGILLVTGPTGSGKSTTLYAALERLNRDDRKIITVEDPVEYKIDGLNQIQVKPDIGLDFARSLRSILRHDPDIIMVGEIRDAETARIATQAALTGHVVLSTLHTNDAASAVTRLLDMGIEDYLITSTVSGVLAQRLVRLLCPECRVPVEMPDALRQSPALKHLTSGPAQVYAPKGCPACRGTGFKGRTVIAELMELNAPIRQIVLSHSDTAQLRAQAMRDGMQTLYENGLAAVFSGRTSYDEVVRVAQDMEDVR
jgi:general secretion pathway protein E